MSIRRAILVAVLAITVIASAPTQAAGTIPVGAYAVQGTNPDASKYELQVRITETPDHKAWLEYFVGGELGAVGIGVRTENVLSVIFQNSLGVTGLASYKVTKDKLDGVWAIPGVEGSGTEKFSKIPALTPPTHPSTVPEPARRPVKEQDTLKL